MDYRAMAAGTRGIDAALMGAEPVPDPETRATASKRGSPTVIRRRFALLMNVLVLAACAAPGPSVISVPARVGPSGLLVRLDVGYQGFDLGHRADYLTDGTVIRWVNGTACGNGQPCGTLERNSLTATGLTAFRALLAHNADLLAQPMVVKRQIAAGTQPLLRGDIEDAFVLERPDGTRYTVQVPSTTSQDANTWVPDPAITRLNALAAAMLDPATLVGAGGLAIRPGRPTSRAPQPWSSD